MWGVAKFSFDLHFFGMWHVWWPQNETLGDDNDDNDDDDKSDLMDQSSAVGECKLLLR
jgi:hypothetical protein